VPLRLAVVTAEREVSTRAEVQRLIVPTIDGQITVLPGHAALMASLDVGEMIAVTDGRQEPMVVHGGFIQVLRDEVTVLADAAEHVDEIDEARAEAARDRAVERIEGRVTLEEALDIARARSSLIRAQVRIRVRRKHRGTGVPSAQP
jgi:F-type H+-transporting ATPase subunit epsilon